MNDKKYFLLKDHPWGSFYVHYTMDFYHNFFNKLQQIVQKDIENELQQAKQNVYQLKKRNQKVEGKLKSFENESFTHVIKRYLLKNICIKKANDIIKDRGI